MNKAYIILAHKNIQQLIRLIRRLTDGHSQFFIHIDTELSQQEQAELKARDNVHLMDRIKVEWAGFSLVQATLNAMEAIRKSETKFEIITLLSGQDYPLKNNRDLDAAYGEGSKKLLIDYFSLPNYEKWPKTGGMYRVNKYFFGLKVYQRYSAKAINLLSRYLPFLRRRLPGRLKPFAGSQWWTIDYYTLVYILDFIRDNPAYARFHRYSFAPDEVFFQTILANATDAHICGNIVNDNRRYMRWNSSFVSHPEVLLQRDLKDMIPSDALFARKLDLYKDPQLFHLIDLHCCKDEMITA